MQIKDWITGLIRLRAVSADPQSFLNYISLNGIIIKHVRWLDDLTVEITVPQSTFKKIKEITKRFQCEITLVEKSGLCLFFLRLFKRGFFITGLLFFVILSIYIQNHILFVHVKGNSAVSSREIVYHAEQSGLMLGEKRKNLRSEQIKNMLLENIPQLQWVGINTSGCVATISVRERTESESVTKDPTPASIIAARDGIITKVISSKGTVLCQAGQRVSAGQILISGINTCGEIMLLTHAEGEVFAETERSIVIQTTFPSIRRSTRIRSDQNIRIFFGKKLINLFKDSGILDTSCVKIRKRYDLALPKGFKLPIGLYCETVSYYDTAGLEEGDNECLWLLEQADDYINTQMIAGSIIKQESELFSDSLCIGYCVNYRCTEMIGKIKKEELFA